MTFIVAPKENILANRYPKVYKTEGIALSALKRNKKLSEETHKVISYEEYKAAANEMVTVKNLMTGKPVQIRAEQRGGCCDPSTETYWCM